MKNKLAIFDIDGTIADHGVIPNSIVAGFKHIQSLGYITTISTGRGYVRAKEALGDAFEALISPESLLITEHGSKIVDHNGTVVKADYFQSDEISHVIDFVRANANMIRLIWFMSPDVTTPVQIWCKYNDDIEKETTKRGHYADIFHCSFEELRQRLSTYPVSSISVKLEYFISVENLKLHFTRSEINALFQDGMMEFIRNIADKSKALLYVQEHHNTQTEDILVAGNAINDVDMLNLPSDKRILVGTGTATDVVVGYLQQPQEVIRVDSPEHLGAYLQTL